VDVKRLRQAGLKEDAIARLVDLKQRVESGERTELTLAYKHLVFVKYLVDSRRLDDEPMR